MRVTPDFTSQAEWQEGNHEHLRYEYDLKPDDLVIDIGAYRGEWAAEIFSRYGCKLIMIEPGPWIVGTEFGQVINKAANDYDGILKFGGAYYYTSAHEDLTHEYDCFDLNTLLRKYDEIALLKMNIEGGEYTLLPHMISAGLHTRIKNLQIQFHIIAGSPVLDWYEAIRTELSKTHHITWQYKFCWENWCLNS